MDEDKIIIGNKYMITGTHGGCTGKRCKDCHPFLEGIIVTEFNSDGEIREVCGKSLTMDSNCSFDPRDLTPVSWKERFK